MGVHTYISRCLVSRNSIFSKRTRRLNGCDIAFPDCDVVQRRLACTRNATQRNATQCNKLCSYGGRLDAAARGACGSIAIRPCTRYVQNKGRPSVLCTIRMILHVTAARCMQVHCRTYCGLAQMSDSRRRRQWRSRDHLPHEGDDASFNTKPQYCTLIVCDNMACSA